MTNIVYDKKPTTEWVKKYYLGQADGEKIYLSAPSWDCGWYWGFGYLGNANCHYHLNGLNRYENINFRDALLKHWDTDSHIFKHDGLTWQFCELVQTAYALEETAETLGRGGSHYTTNPLADLIRNEAEVKRINGVVLPAIFDAIEKTIKGLIKHCSFLNSQEGAFILTDGHYNLCLELMTYEQITKFMLWRKEQGFNVEKDRIEKIKKGEVFKSARGNDIVKTYDVLTGECSVLLENRAYADKANEKFFNEIFEYRKGV